MGSRHGPSRRAILMGAVVVGLILALAVPGIASAALNPAKFYSYRPGSGSTTTNLRPTISVTGYDGYGVQGSAAYSASLDGISIRPRISYYTGYGYKKFTLTYVPTANLKSGSHKVVVSVKDTKGRRYGTSWSFTVQGDTTAPVTTASALPKYPGFFAVMLSATDSGSGVADTFWKWDSGAWQKGPLAGGSATLGAHTLSFYSTDKAGNTEAVKTVSTTVVDFHSTPADISCADTGCHTQNLATIHIARGCDMCHGAGVTPSNDCIACHTSTPPNHAVHVPIPSTTTGAWTCTQALCHGTNVATIHVSCATCHASEDNVVMEAIETGNATCETCHTFDPAVFHNAGTSHTITGTCAGSTCHGPDVSRMHQIDFRGTGDGPPGCYGACHGAGKTPSTNCSNCHADTVTPHDAAAAHATFQLTVGGTKSTACTACHGSNLMAILQVTGEHVGCTCHAFADVRGATECVSCHEGAHAAHGFANGPLGHNTTTYPNSGALSKYDGSQGVLLKDTEEDTITTNWSLPQRNVFWGATDPQAPATAIKGLNWTSVITCQDCHTGLNLAGPHGANDNMGIDPNYDYPYKYAVLGASKGFEPGRTTAATSTSGIKALTTRTETGAVLPIDLDAPVAEESTAGVLGIQDGTSGPYAIICAKCHDLFNPPPGYGVNATTTLDNGWSNAGPDSYEGLHGAHAGGTARNMRDSGRWDGRSDCVACHIGVPHGWKRPRLLVNAYTGPYPLGGFWNGTAWVGYTAAQSVADPAPYNIFRGVEIPEQPLPGGGFNTAGNGPNDAKDDHSLNAFGLPVWEEAACVSCAGGRFPYGLEHNGITSEPAKIK